MLKKEIRKALIEAKNKKENILIEQSLVKSRIMMIVESEDNIKNFNKLSPRKRQKIAFQLFEEIGYLQEQNLLNEGLWDFITGIFGSSWSGLTQMIAEPLVNSILGAIGIEDGYFKNVLVSLLTKNPSRLAKALRGDCKELTGLVVESLIEGFEMKLFASKNATSPGWVFLRNAFNDAIQKSELSQKLEDSLESTICNLFHKFTGKAQEVFNNVK
jgi:hypothetical protein